MQQVNFYQDVFKEIDVPFSGTMLIIVLAYSVIGCVLMTGVLHMTLQLKHNDFSKENQKLVSLVGELEAVKISHPKVVIDDRLVQKIALLETKSEKNKKVINYLEGRNVKTEKQSFLKMLSGLKKVQQPGLWLTKLNFTQGGNEITLNGNMLSADALPEYLKKLSTYPEFTELEFKVFEIQKNSDAYSFVVSSKRSENGVNELLEKISRSDK